MSWRENWLEAYPDWPAILLDRFEQAIKIDLIKFFGTDELGFQPWWAAVISPPAQANYTTPMPPFGGDVNITINLLNPTNPKYATQARWDLGFWYGVNLPLSIWDSGAPQSIQTNMNQSFLGAAFGTSNATLHAYLNFDTRLYYNSFQWNYATIGTLAGIDVSFFGGRNASYVNTLIVAPNASATPYNGADTILALHENGVDNGGVDYAALADFIDYRNAYSKYSQQIAAQKAADQQQQKNDLRSYETELADKLQAEKNALQNLTLTMRQAMKNEAASAERDMVNTVINAQNLKLSLLAAMR